MLSYLEHTGDCWTVREQFWENEEEGDLVYDSCEGTTAERLEDGLRIKVLLPKRLNWMQLADQLRCEVREMQLWAWGLMRKGVSRFDQLVVIERDPAVRERFGKMAYTSQDPFLFLYFYDEKNWVMYESDDEYLFVFDLSNDNNYMGAAHQVDALHFTPHDCLSYISSWLERWYDRVNGYNEGNL